MVTLNGYYFYNVKISNLVLYTHVSDQFNMLNYCIK